MANGSNQYAKRVAHNGQASQDEYGDTRERIARENNVGHATVQRSEEFSKGVDIAEELNYICLESISLTRARAVYIYIYYYLYYLGAKKSTVLCGFETLYWDKNSVELGQKQC